MPSDWLGLLGPLSIVIALASLGVLSRRLGSATRAAPYYAGFFAAALLVAASVIARILNLCFHVANAATLARNSAWTLVYAGLPALGVTVGLVVAWRYWSWLLAERD